MWSDSTIQALRSAHEPNERGDPSRGRRVRALVEQADSPGLPVDTVDARSSAEAVAPRAPSVRVRGVACGVAVGCVAGGRAQAEGDGEAGGASGGNVKKREREAGGGQTGRDNETRSGTNDATAKTVAQTPESSTPTATPAQVTSKRHKTTASTPSIETS